MNVFLVVCQGKRRQAFIVATGLGAGEIKELKDEKKKKNKDRIEDQVEQKKQEKRENLFGYVSSITMTLFILFFPSYLFLKIYRISSI